MVSISSEATSHDLKSKSKATKKDMSSGDELSEDMSDNDDKSNEGGHSSENEEQEDAKDYCKGGYHPVCIGDMYQARYNVLRKLGWVCLKQINFVKIFVK